MATKFSIPWSNVLPLNNPRISTMLYGYRSLNVTSNGIGGVQFIVAPISTLNSHLDFIVLHHKLLHHSSPMNMGPQRLWFER